LRQEKKCFVTISGKNYWHQKSFLRENDSQNTDLLVKETQGETALDNILKFEIGSTSSLLKTKSTNSSCDMEKVVGMDRK